jgi:hypothetical protein
MWKVLRMAKDDERGELGGIGNAGRRYVCECQCGRVSIVTGYRLRSGASTKCRFCAKRKTLIRNRFGGTIDTTELKKLPRLYAPPLKPKKVDKKALKEWAINERLRILKSSADNQ